MASDHEVYCTLVMNDKYLPGAAVLARSLRDTGANRKLACMVTLDAVDSDTLDELKLLYDFILPVDRIANNFPRNLHLLNRLDLLYSFTKINLWRQTQFTKIVYVDADMLALRAPNELFDLDVSFAAAPDIGWPDIFNSGLMVMKPNMGEFWALQNLASSGDSFDGADQGLLNQYYEHRNWHRLSFRYNVTPSGNYQYEPAHRYFKSRVSMVHYINDNKPWLRGRAKDDDGGTYRELINSWWATYDRHYRAASGFHGKRTIQRLTNDSLAVQEPEALLTTTEPPMTDLGDAADDPIPLPTIEQRQHEAPMSQWDATRAPPPAVSQPEAVNFPTQMYEFSHSRDLFRAPQSYPKPPGNLEYSMPSSRAGQTKTVFPWEEREQVRPSRVFADDFGTPEKGFGRTDEEPRPEPTTPRITVSLDDETERARNDKFSRNAWDEIPEIDTFVRKFSQMQQLRGSLSILSQNVRQAQSPIDETDRMLLDDQRSMVLTDFPSAADRPSLPVTPAPIRRQMFWGAERNDKGDLPSAQGVPNQAEWDPNSKLEELRKLTMGMDPNNMVLPAKNVPRRDMPGSALLQHFGGPGAGSEHHVHFRTGNDSPTPRQRASVSSLRSSPSFGSIDRAAGQRTLSPPKSGSPRRMPVSDPNRSPTRTVRQSVS